MDFELIPHPPYSPDLAPCDLFLFPNLKTWLAGKRFSSNEEVFDVVNAYFAGLERSYFSEGMKKLELKETMLTNERELFEKQIFLLAFLPNLSKNLLEITDRKSHFRVINVIRYRVF